MVVKLNKDDIKGIVVETLLELGIPLGDAVDNLTFNSETIIDVIRKIPIQILDEANPVIL